jgi:hypothetical protein
LRVEQNVVGLWWAAEERERGEHVVLVDHAPPGAESPDLALAENRRLAAAQIDVVDADAGQLVSTEPDVEGGEEPPGRVAPS